MSYSADFLIERRKARWSEKGSIEADRELREAIAREITESGELLAEIKRYPEKLIELIFVVVDKNQRTLPFFFNRVQKDFLGILNKAIDDFNEGRIADISLLVLKGRQQGFTTLVTAYQLACSILNRNFQGFTLADKSDNSEAIFQNKAKFPYGQFPSVLKPTEKFNNRKQLLFEKINSSWAVDTATKNVGRSKTINFFHGSECAFWSDGIAPIQAALGEAFTKNCIKIYESTANGYNDYQKMWASGVHINCFFEWWRTPEYRIDFFTEESRQEFLELIESREGWIFTRLKWLRDVKSLSDEQLNWYYRKYEKYLDKDIIKQEYPCTPSEAFLLSGKTVFDTEILLRRLSAVTEPLKTGYFEYDYDGLSITNIRWINDRNGYIKIYQLPTSPVIGTFAIGGDTAGDGSDFFTAHVVDARTGNQAAVMKHRFDPDQYSKQMYCLGAYYRWALIGIESNFDTYPIMELQRLGYPNQYVREVLDTYTGKTEKRFGFKTTTLTRPPIISRLVEVVREHSDTINDKDTIEELMTIVKNESGKAEAPEGGHDDQMMGLGIAHQVKEQVVLDDTVILPESHFGFSSEMQYSSAEGYGEKTEVI